MTLRSESEGGRQSPAFTGYRPQHKVLDDYQTSGQHDYIDCEQIAPGGTGKAKITFITPDVYPQCLWIGREILIQEGSRVVGIALVTKIMNRTLERIEQDLSLIHI